MKLQNRIQIRMRKQKFEIELEDAILEKQMTAMGFRKILIPGCFALWFKRVSFLCVYSISNNATLRLKLVESQVFGLEIC